MKKSNKLVISLIAVLASFVVATIVMLLTGINPGGFFTSIIRTITGVDIFRLSEDGAFNARYIGEFLQISLIIILTGLSVGFAFRTGLFNIGAEGQLIMGSLGAAIVGLTVKLPFIIHLPLALIVAMIFGAAWGFVPGYLKAKFGIHEVVVTIMLNYAALFISNYVLRLLPGSTSAKTATLPDSVLLKSKLLFDLTNRSRFHWGFVVVIIAIVLYKFVINKTTFGYELRAVGYNQNAAKYAGIKVKSRMIYSMAISGAFAGLAGALVILGTFGFGRVINTFENYGFDGIAVALLGGNTGIGILFSGLLFGALKSSQPLMQVNKIPLEIAMIVSALIVLFVAMTYGFQMLLNKLRKEKKEDKNE